MKKVIYPQKCSESMISVAVGTKNWYSHRRPRKLRNDDSASAKKVLFILSTAVASANSKISMNYVVGDIRIVVLTSKLVIRSHPTCFRFAWNLQYSLWILFVYYYVFKEGVLRHSFIFQQMLQFAYTFWVQKSINIPTSFMI